MKNIPLLKWLIPLFLVLMGIFFHTAVHGHGFLGLISFGIAGVISAYFLIALLTTRYFSVAKVLNLVLTGILSGGQGADERISEATCMFRELTAMGIPESQLWLEDKATSTWENLTFSLNLIAERTGSRPDRLGVLSSEYPLFRASLFAADCGVEAVGIPASTALPTIRLNYFLREVAGVWHYIIFGGQYHD